MVKIRLAYEKDLELLAQVYVDVYEAFDVGERWDKESALKLMRYWFARKPDLFFVAEKDDRLVGAFVADIEPWWDGNHLLDGEIFVHPDFQKKGVGTELTKTMFETALEKYDAKVWCFYTFRNPEFPKKWYEKMGFEEIKEWMMISGDLKKAFNSLK